MRSCSIFLILLLLAGCGKHKEQPPSILFVFLTSHGELKKEQKGDFKLTLDHSYIERVVAFSDRPYRIVEQITPEGFEEFWEEGEHSYADDPPNATVVIDEHLFTVEVLHIKVEKGVSTFTVRSDGKSELKEARGITELFIDGFQYGRLLRKV